MTSKLSSSPPMVSTLSIFSVVAAAVSSSIFTSKSQKIINELEDKNKDLRDELMDVRMHSYGETSRKIANFWKEQCRALDPVLTADKEAQLTAAHQKSVEARRTDIAIPAVSTRPVKK